MGLYTYDPDLFSHKNTASVIWYTDPDAIAHYYATVIEHETTTQGDIIETLPDLFDPNVCPKQYLPYLANMIGLVLDLNDREETWRSQIKSAVRWYKEKGKLSAFNLVLYTMGMTAEIYPLWIDETGTVDRFPHDSSWKPHARIDIKLNSYTEWRRYLPEKLQYVFHRLEEVRPIHVLIRGFFLNWDMIDYYDYVVDDELNVDVNGNLADAFNLAYNEYCNLWHAGIPAGVKRNGGGYYWLSPAIDFSNTPPPTNNCWYHDALSTEPYRPVHGGIQYRDGTVTQRSCWITDPSSGEEPLSVPGNRYIVAEAAIGSWAGHEGEIAEWNGYDWQFYVPRHKDALWLFHSPNGRNSDHHEWKAYFFDSDPATVEENWTYRWKLFENRDFPGPYFRDCNGRATLGPDDTLSPSYVNGFLDEEWPETCAYHDALAPMPQPGYILRRDGTRRRECHIVLDLLDISKDVVLPPDNFPVPVDLLEIILNCSDHIFPQDRWDNGEWDSGMTWDAGTFIRTWDDEEETWDEEEWDEGEGYAQGFMEDRLNALLYGNSSDPTNMQMYHDAGIESPIFGGILHRDGAYRHDEVRLYDGDIEINTTP